MEAHKKLGIVMEKLEYDPEYQYLRERREMLFRKVTAILNSLSKDQVEVLAEYMMLAEESNLRAVELACFLTE